MSQKKILVISHGHPSLSPGGGERAAYNLFKFISSQADFDAMFVAAVPQASSRNYARIQTYNNSKRELLVNFPPVDHFNFISSDPRELKNIVCELLDFYNPDIVHLHHFVNVGIDIISTIKELGRNIKIVLTIHEYLLICLNHGQMLRQNGSLCSLRTYRDCNNCFPHIPTGDFFLRQKFFSEQLRLCDAIHSPSKFLVERFISNKFDIQNAVVIENVQSKPITLNAKKRNTTNDIFRLAYFGQINKFKGVMLLKKLSEELKRRNITKVTLDVYGNIYKDFDKDFTEEFFNWIKNDNLVNYHGIYDGDDAISLMSNYDCVVVPSIWWENSPVVIQEAKAAGVWIIGSDIGGIKEKLEEISTARVFRRLDSIDLCDKIVDIMNSSLPVPVNEICAPSEMFRYISLYKKIYL